MSRKKWTVSQYDKDMAAELAESYELDPFAALLLVSRGVTADNADEFLYPQCDIDPFLLPDMEKAANRIRKAIESFEKIAVFGDYDAVSSSTFRPSFDPGMKRLVLNSLRIFWMSLMPSSRPSFVRPIPTCSHIM